MATEPSQRYATARPAPAQTLRDGVWMVVHTVHIGVMLTKDGSTAVLMHNDGMTSRSPGLMPEQAERLAAMLTEAAAESRASKAAAAPDSSSRKS